ncbi:MAG: hypothetical protein J6K89_06700 [Oscillospiraceae bacterium]|nr:hypothetical protein [Oscillospiraceae bacterium]
MKKFIAMMLCIIMILSLVACGKDEAEPTETTTEPTTETTEAPTTEEPTTEAPTEETTEEFVEEIPEFEVYDFKFVERDADYNEIEIKPTELMLLLQSLYDDFPADQRPTPLHIRVLSADEYEMNYLPTDIEGMEVIAAEPLMSAVPHFTSIITAPEGTDPKVITDYIDNNIDPELRSKWCSAAAETYAHVISGNNILFVMGTNDFVAHAVDAFTAKTAQ